MSELATKEVRRKRPAAKAMTSVFVGVAAVLVLSEWACGSGTGTGPTAFDPPAYPAPAVSVTGTWSGGNGGLHLFWRLRT
jgi:hypothetical protein